MQITRSSVDAATTTGPADWFTGDVYIDTVATASVPSRAQASEVHFMPGARTAVSTSSPTRNTGTAPPPVG